MTGLDCLREELASRGLSTQQINSKAVAVVLDVVAQSGNKYTEMWKSEQDVSKRERDALNTIMWAEHKEIDLNARIEKAERALELCEEKKRQIESYVSKMCEALENCETPEGRDTMRIAQMFVNTVNVDTKYDNTAYIIGLAAILSMGGISPIDELKKINKKLPDIDTDCIIPLRAGRRR